MFKPLRQFTVYIDHTGYEGRLLRKDVVTIDAKTADKAEKAALLGGRSPDGTRYSEVMAIVPNRSPRFVDEWGFY